MSDERLRIPPAYAVPCEFCGEVVDMRAAGTFQYTSGWVERRDSGGGHGISLPLRERRFAHGRCIRERAAGMVEQGSLL